jgi:phosphatidylcholine synthase
MEASPTLLQRARAHAVHAYTASGVALAFLAAAEMCQREPQPRTVFAYLLGAVLIDATDGTLARRWRVKQWAASIDGRTIDDIVDYLTYTFLPLLLMWRMDWLPQPAWIFIFPALIASLFGFSNTKAKDEANGFFLGFPSYWNVMAFYGGLWTVSWGTWANAALLLLLALLTVLPVRFLYPNLTPRPWRTPILIGALLWLLMLFAILVQYSRPPLWLVWASLAYPLFYAAVSLYLDERWSHRSAPPAPLH